MCSETWNYVRHYKFLTENWEKWKMKWNFSFKVAQNKANLARIIALFTHTKQIKIKTVFSKLYRETTHTQTHTHTWMGHVADISTCYPSKEKQREKCQSSFKLLSKNFHFVAGEKRQRKREGGRKCVERSTQATITEGKKKEKWRKSSKKLPY